MSDKTLPKLSSMAAPTDEDLAAFNALPDDDKRALLVAEIEKGLQGKPRKSTAADVVRRGMERKVCSTFSALVFLHFISITHRHSRAGGNPSKLQVA